MNNINKKKLTNRRFKIFIKLIELLFIIEFVMLFFTALINLGIPYMVYTDIVIIILFMSGAIFCQIYDSYKSVRTYIHNKLFI